MRVIQTPDVEGWRHTFDCGQCTAKLEIGVGDLVRVKDGGVDGEGAYDPMYELSCPVCKTRIYLPGSWVPRHVRHAIPEAPELARSKLQEQR